MRPRRPNGVSIVWHPAADAGVHLSGTWCAARLLNYWWAALLNCWWAALLNYCWWAARGCGIQQLAWGSCSIQWLLRLYVGRDYEVLGATARHPLRYDFSALLLDLNGDFLKHGGGELVLQLACV